MSKRIITFILGYQTIDENFTLKHTLLDEGNN